MTTRFLLFLFVFLSSFCLRAQSQVDSVAINGKFYKIYPIREKIDIPEEYWYVVKDEAYFEDPNNYFSIFGESRAFDRSSYENTSPAKLERLNKKLAQKWKPYRKNPHNGLGFKQVVRKDPAAVITPNYTFNNDILPPFSAIPDGEYVQLFSDFCLVDKTGNCQEQTERVAAYFTIKNNALDGLAVWVDLHGDTIKSGQFTNGLKDGEWKFSEYSSRTMYLRRYQVKHLKLAGSINSVSKQYVMNFKNGVKDGSYTYRDLYENLYITGTFDNGIESGNWRTFWNDTLIFNVTHAPKDSSIRSHRPLIRTGQNIISGGFEFNTKEYTYAPMSIPKELIEFDFGIDTELELEEEEFQSLQIENYYNEYDYYNPDYPQRILDRLANSNNNPYDYYGNIDLYEFVTDPNSGLYETRGHFTDSIGAKVLYDGAYEIYYPSGQLFTRYTFQDGELIDEGTLYWDNGQVLDSIEFNADSNKFYRHSYDYDGLLMTTAIYDSLGDFLRFDGPEKEKVVTLEIDGYLAELDEISYTNMDYAIVKQLQDVFPGNYVYRNFDLLDSVVPSETVSLYRQYSGYDSTTLLSEVIYDPENRTYVDYENSYLGNEYYRLERTFTEDFKSWTGKTTLHYGDFTVVNTASGILYDFETDTLPIQHVMRSYSDYDVTTDTEIFKNGVLYTGKFKYKNVRGRSKFYAHKLVLKSGNGIAANKVARQLKGYLTKGKHSKNVNLMLVMEPESCQRIEELLWRNLFSTASLDFFNYRFDSNSNWGYSRDVQCAKIHGQLVEGKAQGDWTGKASGKLMTKISFDRDEPIGTFERYGISKRATRYTRKYSNDTLPRKNVHFLAETIQYVNGMAEGPYRDYTWYGSVQEEGQFENDHREGVFRRTFPEAYSVSQYKNGFLDGYVQTYLTLPEMNDTILLYDLNFQHGLLNGESNAYHTNGRIAKRGFFLDGEPIDDYEAYDTLGFRYHYVKFKFGYPIEEKIWEENQLSLRYQFNWEDSIEFDPSDITNSMSLDQLMLRLGYGRVSADDLYFGRPRLIDKTGLKYHMTKFYPNDTIARIGEIVDGKKIGEWQFYDYDGTHLYDVNYFDSVIVLNDSIRFKSKGVLTDIDDSGNELFKAFIIEKMEKYDCAHTDHYEIRQLYTTWEADDSLGRMNGFVQNFYDNGVLQNEGEMKDGLPTGLWKYYDPFGKLNLMGSFVQGKRHGRWLQGDLEKKKYLGEICLNPNLPDLEEEQKYRENLIDVSIITYYYGQSRGKQFYDLNLNRYSNLIDSDE